MTRVLVLGSLVAVGILSVTLAAVQAPAPAAPAGAAAQSSPSAAGITVDKITDRLYVLRGGGGNTAVFITADGVTLVDTKIYGWAQPLMARLKEITDKPVIRIVNTHTHYDHSQGNPDFPATVEVVTHENTARLMREWNPVYGGASSPEAARNVFKDSNGRGLPTRTFKDRMTIGRGDDRIELHYFGRAHTSGDAFVVFPALRAMHTGDAFPNKGVPIIDSNNGGSALEYADTVAKAAALPNIAVVITGHNNMTLGIADVKMYSDFVRALVTDARAAKQAGQTIDDVSNTWKVPQQFLAAGYAQPAPARLKSNVEVIFKEAK